MHFPAYVQLFICAYLHMSIIPIFPPLHHCAYLQLHHRAYHTHRIYALAHIRRRATVETGPNLMPFSPLHPRATHRLSHHHSSSHTMSPRVMPWHDGIAMAYGIRLRFGATVGDPLPRFHWHHFGCGIVTAGYIGAGGASVFAGGCRPVSLVGGGRTAVVCFGKRRNRGAWNGEAGPGMVRRGLGFPHPPPPARTAGLQSPACPPTPSAALPWPRVGLPTEARRSRRGSRGTVSRPTRLR